MDKSGFGIKKSQIIKYLIYLNKQYKNKRIMGKQKQILNIKYISIANNALPPIII